MPAQKILMPGIFVYLMTICGAVFSQDETTNEADQLPTATDVINRYVEALGGQMALETVESLQTTGHVEEVEGDLTWKELSFVWQKNRWAVQYGGPGFQHQTGTAGRRSWSRHADGQERWLSNEQNLWYRTTIDCSFRKPLEWLTRTSLVEVKGQEEIDGKRAWRLEFWHSPKAKVVRHFDVESGLLVQSDNQINYHDQVKTFGDYRDVNGIKFPFKIAVRHKEGSTRYVLKVDEVLVDEAVDENFLAIPASLVNESEDVLVEGVITDRATGQPLPDIRITAWSAQGRKQIETFTDGEGRYRIFGTANPEGEPFRFTIAPAIDQPWFVSEHQVDLTEGKPDRKDIALDRAMIFRGRLVDAKSGTGIQGYVSLEPEVKPELPTDGSADSMMGRMMRLRPSGFALDEGCFWVKVVPGNHRMLVRMKESDKYPYVDVPDSFTKRTSFNDQKKWHGAQQLVVAANASKERVFQFASNQPVFVEILQPDGTQATDLYVAGDFTPGENWSDSGFGSKRSTTKNSPLEIYGLEEIGKRTLLVLSKDKTQGAVVQMDFANVTTDENGNLSLKAVELSPCWMLKGKFVKEGFSSANNIVIKGFVGDHEVFYSNPNDDRTFEFPGILPGADLQLQIFGSVQTLGQNKLFNRQFLLTPNTTEEEGNVIDVGEISLPEIVTLQGRVTDAETAEPIADAEVRVDYSGLGNIIGQTDSDGNYKLVLGSMFSSARWSGREVCKMVITVRPNGGPCRPVRQKQDAIQSAPIGPLIVDLELPRGALMQGKVVEKGTGRPVDAVVEFRLTAGKKTERPTPQNAEDVLRMMMQPNAPRMDRFSTTTETDGSFALGVEKPNGTLSITAKQRGRYASTHKAPFANFVLPLEPDSKKLDELLIELEPLSIDTIEVQNASGEPVKNFSAWGHFPQNRSNVPHQLFTWHPSPENHMRRPQGIEPVIGKFSNKIDVFGLQEGASDRLLIVMSEDRTLSAARELEKGNPKMDDTEALVLTPVASIRGKVTSHNVSYVEVFITANRPGQQALLDFERSVPDGEFSFDHITPGIEVQIRIHAEVPVTRASRRGRGGGRHVEMRRVTKIKLLDPLTPGQQLDLGEINLNEW